jgi:hypothetical protein
MVRPWGRHLVAQRRDHAARSCPDAGPSAGRGPRRTDGQPRDDRPLPAAPGPVTSMEAGLTTPRDQRSLGQQTGAERLTVVVIVTTPRQPPKTAPVGWFRREVPWGDGRVLDAARWRVPRACHGREAKPYGGLKDFLRVHERPGSHRAPLALFMVNVSHALIRPMRTPGPALRVRDLKAWCRGRTSGVDTFTWLPERPEALLLDQVISHMAVLGRVNHAVHPA